MTASAGIFGLTFLIAVSWTSSGVDAGTISAAGQQGMQAAADSRRSMAAFTAPAGPLGSLHLAPGLSSVCPAARSTLPAAPSRQHGGIATLVAQYRGRGSGGGGRGRGRGARQMPIAPRGPPMNSEIPFSEMRVVVANPDGKDEMLGVLTKEQALAEADERVRPAPSHFHVNTARPSGHGTRPNAGFWCISNGSCCGMASPLGICMPALTF